MDKTIDIDGLKLAYTVIGNGPRPVIVMHGWGCSGSTVNVLAQACADESTTVYNIDLPGFGASDEPSTPWSVYDYCSAIEKFVAMQGHSVPPVLVGHSFGGRIAIIYGSRNNTDRLILVDAAGVKPRRSFKYYFKVYTFKAARKVLPLLTGKKRADAIIERWRGKAGSADYRSASPLMRRIMSLAVNEDLKYLMPSIKAPSLLIWGTEDTATPLADAKVMEKLIPDAGLVAFDGCGHYSFLERPAQTAAVIASFLNFKH